MSTVLWANLLIDGVVQSDESDHHALYRHAKKLDAISRSMGLPPFQSICDTTDLRYNLGNEELPDGVSSTNEVMAKTGAWLPLTEAIQLLEGLLSHIQAKSIRFGLLKNQHAEVVDDLKEVVAFARAAPPNAQKFNFCVVT